MHTAIGTGHVGQGRHYHRDTVEDHAFDPQRKSLEDNCLHNSYCVVKRVNGKSRCTPEDARQCQVAKYYLKYPTIF